MVKGPVPVAQVIALMRADDVTEGFLHALETGKREFNRHGNMLDLGAACALACVHPDSQYAARIATTRDVLWERGSQGTYDIQRTFGAPRSVDHAVGC